MMDASKNFNPKDKEIKNVRFTNSRFSVFEKDELLFGLGGHSNMPESALEGQLLKIINAIEFFNGPLNQIIEVKKSFFFNNLLL
jgi:hypothetical protein